MSLTEITNNNAISDQSCYHSDFLFNFGNIIRRSLIINLKKKTVFLDNQKLLDKKKRKMLWTLFERKKTKKKNNAEKS